MQKCDNCPYCRMLKMPPLPLKKSPIVVVGEAPIIQDIGKQKLFSGPGGDLLNKVFEKIGVSKEEIFFTNALRCVPPPKQGISKVAINNCRSRVINEIKEINPKIIIALGNTALHCLTGNFSLKITQEQGRVIYSPELPTLPIIPCVHPVLVLRAAGNYKNFESSLTYANTILKTGKIKDPGKIEFTVIEYEDQLHDSFQLIKQAANEGNILGADIETSNKEFYWRGKPIDLGICYEPNNVLIYTGDIIPLTKPLFTDPDLSWSWHFGNYDTVFLQHQGLPAVINHDTLIMHYTLNENEGGHDLDTLSTILLGAPAYKDVVKKYVKPEDGGYENVPKEILWPYLAKDCVYTRQLTDLLLPQVESDPLLNNLYYNLLIPSANFLRRVQLNGMLTDDIAINRLAKELSQQQDKVTAEIIEQLSPYWNPELYKKQTGMKTAGETITVTSPYQLGWLLYNRLRLVPPKRTKSTSKDILKEMIGQHPVISKILEFRSITKMKGTYVDGIMKRRDEDKKVHPMFRVTGTVTGRLSSRNPNSQNIPRNPMIKDIFIAPEGYKLMELDYKGAELRMLAYLSGDEELIKVFMNDLDLHDEVSIMMYGPNFTKDQRVRAKAVNFGIVYGRKSYTIAMEYKIPEKEAQDIIDTWFKRFSKAHQYLLECDKSAEEGKVLITPLGRKRRFGLVTKNNIEELKNEARNFRVQSTTSDMTLLSGLELEQWLLDEQVDAQIINLVHDSILLIVRDDPKTLKKVAQAAQQIMESMPAKKLNTDIPFPVDIKVGDKWGHIEEFEM